MAAASGGTLWVLAAKGLLFCVGSFCYALLGVLSQLSKGPGGKYEYSMPSVVLTAEAVKFFLSACFLTAEAGSVSSAASLAFGGGLRAVLAFAIPSVLYSVNNNLDMLNNQYMDPATEQVLVQLKILTTGVVWFLVFRKPLGARKWLALVLLFIGAACAASPSQGPSKEGVKTMYIEPFGMFLVFCYVIISACAGVYNEWLYKGIGKDHSIHACNLWLYTVGCAFNFSAYASNCDSGRMFTGLLDGYNRYTWGLVATYSLMGLLLSQVMKHFDSIVKLFISGSSMYVSAIMSWLIFGYSPTPTFVLALLLVSAALLLYNAEKLPLILGPKAVGKKA